MQKVFKYDFGPDIDDVGLMMPDGAKILHVDAQRNVPYIWAQVDPEAIPVKRRFKIYGTGDVIEEDEDKLYHHGSFFMDGRTFVFHLFEVM